ncbi:XdhC/CoxI family protein [Anaerococcus sp.]|uniref:XdhC family protein n=1 Tax=Anaerococcus sp. TaxID=1872515 RepID=UPI002A75FD0B|nr:XdhC/CoxI family protein [Anaerococcus sp.]MDY2927437.1 XdhC/CoxI family protein [Anaerococcus sp.]
MKADILEKIYEENQKGRDAALVFLIENKGSTPGEDNSLMAVTSAGKSFGTIGGGKIEADVIRRCMEGFPKGESFEFDYNLSQNGELKMSCGGDSRGFVKYFKAANSLVIFGAGHISQKLARIATKTNFEVTVIDDRSEFRESPDFSEIKDYIDAPIEEAVDKIDFDKDKTYIVLCNRGHAHDAKALRKILGKDFHYLGMIGSKAKVIRVFKELEEEGYKREDLEQIYTPIGLDVDNGSVEEIAISIMAEILMIKNKKTGEIQKLH